MPKLKIAHVIGKAVWDQRGDIRDVISIGKLVRKNDGPEEVEQILSTMTKYGQNYNNVIAHLEAGSLERIRGTVRYILMEKERYNERNKNHPIGLGTSGNIRGTNSNRTYAGLLEWI